jgi:hypothetical protein
MVVRIFLVRLSILSVPVTKDWRTSEHLTSRMISTYFCLCFWTESTPAFTEGFTLTTFLSGIIGNQTYRLVESKGFISRSESSLGIVRLNFHYRTSLNENVKRATVQENLLSSS